ncbi:MAG: efflux RND transporter periplasmic adaptor subunit [Patescibacteria group bacterium]|jgi:RND family efflux transporter MFP subunit|nr:efflux RND transporter periplasmic adaptor subunit [Patescibacteria group bacterium]
MNINFKNKYIIISLIVLLIFLLAFFVLKDNEEEESVPEKIAIPVSVISVGNESVDQDKIEAVGSVKADSQIKLVAMESATVRGVFFDIGDNIVLGQRLVSLGDNTISSNLLIAQNDYLSRKNSLEIVKTSTEQDIQSSEINVANARESLELSKIQLKTAQDNYDNGIIQIDKNKIDLKNNAVITHNNNLSILFDTLDQINFIIKAEGDKQISGIKNVIAAKDKQSLSKSTLSYFNAKNSYTSLLSEPANPEKALDLINKSVNCLQLTKVALDDLILVLDSTVSSVDFSETTLSTQISKFNQLRISILGIEAKTKSLEQSIENIEINSKADIDRLDNSLAAAKNQIKLSEIALQNTELGLEKTKNAKDQQIISAEIAQNNTLGQLNLARQRAGDLSINSPISGIVTKKMIEVGQEVSPGTQIGEISKLDLIKIIIMLPYDEAYRIKTGDGVLIENKFKGFISQINPSADSLSKKVEVEIAYDNENKDLIAETFVNIDIPTNKNIKSKNNFFLLPLKAVSISQNENFVFLNENGIAVKRKVEIGEVQNNLVEIITGLSEEDSLIIEGNKNLNDGDKIEINL